MGSTRTVATATIKAITTGDITMRATSDGVLIEPPAGTPRVIVFTGDPDSPTARHQYQRHVAEHVPLVKRRTS